MEAFKDTLPIVCNDFNLDTENCFLSINMRALRKLNARAGANIPVKSCFVILKL